MKLLAVYIRNYAKIFNDVCLQFSNDKFVTFKNNLIEVRNNDDNYKQFYGEIFEDITAIVGKNGTGKTSILNIIGSSFKDRIENVNIENGEIVDSYFMVFQTSEESIYYIEQVGDFSFNNIHEYNQVLIKDGKTRFHSFYFQIKENNYKVIYYKSKHNDRIVYLTDQYQVPKSDLIDLMNDNHLKMLPRVRRMIVSLKEWYIAYTNLYRSKVIDSSEIRIIFRRNEEIKLNQKIQNIFLLQAQVHDCTTKIDPKVLFTEENFNDFISHQINILTVQFIGKITEYFEEESIQEFVKRYNQKIIIWNEEEIKKYFGDLRGVFDSINFTTSDSTQKYQYLELLNLYSEFFENLFKIKEFIVPGLYEFTLILYGNSIHDNILSFCHVYDDLELYIRKLQPLWLEREDVIYEDEYNPLETKIGIDALYTDLIPLASSGEKKIISIIGNLSSEIKEYVDMQPWSFAFDNKTYIVLVDEIEKEMHLEWSRNLINYLIEYFEAMEHTVLDKKYSIRELNIKIQLIFSTHSPFMLSDLHGRSVLELEKKEEKVHVRLGEKVFAQNIQRIINSDFFVSNCYGAYAEKRINDTIAWLRSNEPYTNEEMKAFNNIINEVGEVIVHKKLCSMYKTKTNKNIKEQELIDLVQQIYPNHKVTDIQNIKKAIEDVIKSNSDSDI